MSTMVETTSDHDAGLPTDGLATVDREVEEEIQRLIPERFCVNDEKSAAWVVRRIIAARHHAEAVRDWAALETRRAQREEERLLYLFGAQLQRWTDDEVTKLRGRRRSISLPDGTLGFRTVPASLRINDESLVIRWAVRSCPSAVATVQRLRKTPIMEYFEATGELPEGAEIVAPHPNFYIR